MGNITLREAIDEYKNVYMAYRNFAERTRIEYLNDLEDFIEFVQKSGANYTGEVGLPIIERFVADLEQKGFASFTRKRKVVSIRSFLLFLYQDGHITTDIAKRVVLPFTESATPNILTQTECDRLREACAGNPRDRAIIELLLQTGIKLSELTRLTSSDIEFDRDEGKTTGFVRIAGSRGKKDRMIPLNNLICAPLENYLHERTGNQNITLFSNRFSEPLGERGVQKMLRRYLKMAGIAKASVNTLRHTFGAYHIARGTSLKTIQEVLGHKDGRSTLVYVPFAKNIVSREMQGNSL